MLRAGYPTLLVCRGRYDLFRLKTSSLTKTDTKKMVMSDIFERLPGADKQAIESTVHYISNMLNNEAQRQLSQKITENRKQTGDQRESETVYRHTNMAW